MGPEDQTQTHAGLDEFLKEIKDLASKNPNIAKLVRTLYFVAISMFLLGASGTRELLAVKNDISDLKTHGSPSLEAHAKKQAEDDKIMAEKLGALSANMKTHTDAINQQSASTKQLAEAVGRLSVQIEMQRRNR